ncbi:MAG: hypothetical protein Kow0040_14670 [Thermogutta sp.]
MLWIVLYVTLAVVESGDWSAPIRAQQLFHEVYGKRIEAAKTSAEKSALAREILEIAKKESDSAAKRVELEEAKRLAVEAHDLAIAIEAVRVIAAQSPKGEISDDEQLLRAEAVWQDAEAKTGVERLYKQLDSLHEFFRVPSPPVLVKKRWEQRIEQVKSGGAIVLEARDARCVGRSIVYKPGFDLVLYWKSPQEYMEWEAVLEPGQYQVELQYSADPQMGWGSLMAVSVFLPGARSPLASCHGTFMPTGTWGTVGSTRFSDLRITKQGRYVIRLHVLRYKPQSPGRGIISPRKIILARR